MALPNGPDLAAPSIIRSASSSARPADAGGLDVDVDTSIPPVDLGGMMGTSTADGGMEVDTDPNKPAPTGDPTQFNANLAAFMDDGDLDEIGNNLVERVESDDKTRSEWQDTIAEGIELLGTRVEDMTWPFPEASDAFSPLMPKAVYRNWAKSMSQLLPPSGPVRCQIPGDSNQDLQDQADRKSDWMNLYLTSLDKSYYPDTTQMIWWWVLVGSTFKKVYQHPLKRRPVAPFIRPENFICAYSTTNIYTATRLTHRFFPSLREIKLMQARGIWVGDTDVTMDMMGQEKNPVKRASDEAEGLEKPMDVMSPFQEEIDQPYFETHVDYDLGDMEIGGKPAWQVLGSPEGVPVPLKITMSANEREVVRIDRNWRQGDDVFDRKNCFVHYKLLPGTGFYGFGYAHILGNLARTGTALRRQIIDSATLSMFPGGLRDANAKIDDNNKLIGPCEWVPITTGGVPLGDVFKPMPYKDISPTTLQLLQYTDASGDDLANTAEIAVGDGRQDAPVGTTLALQEGANLIATAMVREGHFAQREEFSQIADLFGENLPEKPYPFVVASGEKVIMRADFQNNIQVIPVSDPGIVSNAQRIQRAQVKLQVAQQFPQNHNMYAVLFDLYRALGDEPSAINQYLTAPGQAKPFDPLTENMNAIMGMPLEAGPMQDHAAHIQAHMPLAQMPAMQAHISQHMALQLRTQIEAQLGMPLPPPGTPLPPQVENQIAILVAKATKALMDQQPKEPSAGEIAMADIEVKKDAIKEKAFEAQLRASVDAFREQMRAWIDQENRESRMRIVAVQSAADAFKNKVPPIENVLKLIELAEMMNIPGIGKNGGVDAHVKLRAPAAPKGAQ